jgi:hypothetical protein
MTCQECRDQWSALLDAELSLMEIKASWAHLQSCPECCRYCCELVCLDAMVRCLDTPSVSERLGERLQEKWPPVMAPEQPWPAEGSAARPQLSRLGRL